MCFTLLHSSKIHSYLRKCNQSILIVASEIYKIPFPFKIYHRLPHPRSQFTVDMQTTASRGLVFYTGTENSFLALFLTKGRLVFALGAGGKKLRLKSKEKCNDGQWHTVRTERAVPAPPGGG